MKALLDTHVFLWWVTEDSRLSSTARSIITDSSKQLFLSAASAWEIVIKARLGKLILPEAPEVYIPNRLAVNRFESLSIHMIHALQVVNLPDLHKDEDVLKAVRALVANEPELSAQVVRGWLMMDD